MKVKERHFPYPVLADFSDDFNKSSYETDIDYTINRDQFVLNVKHALNNEELAKMIEDGKAEYATHIECPKTQKRLLNTSNIQHQEVILDAADIENKIEVCTFVIATMSLSNYTNSDFDVDYEGYVFNLNKGDILAIGHDYNISVEKEQKNDAESIIQFVKSKESKKTFDIEYESNKILVKLDEEQYALYNSLAADEELLPVLYSLIGVPVITSALQVIGNEIQNIDSGNTIYSDYRWFRVLEEKISSLGEDPYNESIYGEVESLELTQRLLENPLSSSLQALVDYNDNDEDAEEDF